MITQDQPISLIGLSEVIKRTGLCRAAVYREMKTGNFPQSVRIGLRSVRWVSSEIQAWIEARIEQRKAA